MLDEQQISQATPVPGGGKGKGREVVVYSDIEELDGSPSPKSSSLSSSKGAQ